MKIHDQSLEELIPYPVLSVPIIWVKPDDKAWLVASLLNRYLGSFADSVVVIDNGQYVGVIDGRELLTALLKNPTYDFFQNSTAKDFMVKENVVITLQMKVSELIKRWEKTRRDYAIFENSKDNFATLSARTLTDASAFLCNDLKTSDIQKNEVIACHKDNTIGELLQLMFRKQVRRVFYDNHVSFVSDRTIIKKIVMEFEFLHKIDKFLELPISQIESTPPIIINKELSFLELCRVMTTKENPCLLFQNNYVMAYHDIVMSLKNFLV